MLAVYMIMTVIMCLSNIVFEFDDDNMKKAQTKALLPHIMFDDAELAKAMFYSSITIVVFVCLAFLPCLGMLTIIQCQNVI